MEGELFVDGQPPDFSVLQELLCPPCLESEPSRSPIPNPKGVGPETAAATAGESRFEPFVGMACCISTPDSKALNFLQESAQLLSQPRAISTTAGRPLWQAGGPPLRPKTSNATAPRSSSLPGAAALASFAPLDALSLISLHCSSLELEPAARIAPAEVGAAPAPEGPPAARSKDCGADLLRRAPGGKPLEAPAPLPPETGSPRHKPEPPKGRGRVPRKQPRPRRSCESRDPAFQGVTFQMQLRLCHSSAAGCRLLVRHRYSRYIRGRRRKKWALQENPGLAPRVPTRSAHKICSRATNAALLFPCSTKWPGTGKPRKRSRIPLAKEDDRPGTSEEEDGCLSTHRNKRCASCKTRKTPLWRDAEDGTPLCNACGIRYKKYRIRCFRCWNIPKHGGKPYSHCSSCGGRLHVVTAQQKSGKRCAAS